MTPERVAELEGILERGRYTIVSRLVSAQRWPTRLFEFSKPPVLPVFDPEYLDNLPPAEFKKLHDKYGNAELDAWLDSLTDEERKELTQAVEEIKAENRARRKAGRC
jgi:hypothetical protein